MFFFLSITKQHVCVNLFCSWDHHREPQNYSRTFSFTVSCWWNDLPTLIWNAESITAFKRQL